MEIKIYPRKKALALDAAKQAANAIREAISRRGEARIVAATGSSQLDFLDFLTKIEGIDWKKVEMFHLDEYVGLSEDSPVSFCRYLKDHLINKVAIGKYHLLDGTQPPAKVIEQTTMEIRKAPIDILFAGVGENGHLAFNDPPADFDTNEAYIVVTLDKVCRRQQVTEGWFPSIADVPRQAISMTIRQIMKAQEIICLASDARKAKAIKACFEGDVTPLAPASILQRHPNATLYLDKAASSLLSSSVVASPIS